MKYLKYTSYLFLVIAVALLIDGFLELEKPDGRATLSFIFAGVCVFMFFFRRNMAKKMENRSKGQ
jgi:hypothetical protein